MEQNRRLHVRRNLFTRGRILHPKFAVDCMLHNISAGGALVSVGDADLPTHFILQIPGNHEIRRPCVLVWRDGEWAGMRFVTPDKRRRPAAADTRDTAGAGAVPASAPHQTRNFTSIAKV
jgi:hypothetical protein